jgi:hypothetical protein
LASVIASFVHPPVVVAAPADAEATEVGVAPLVLEGDVEPAWRSSLADALARGLARAGLSTHPLPQRPGECDGPCWAARAQTAGHDLVVVARVVEHERLYEVELEARDADDGSVVLASKQPCQPCGRVEVEDQLERQAAALADSLLRLDRSPAVLVVESRPTGAEVLVDGKLVGKTPLELPLASGTHRVQTRISGHEPREREFTAVRGVRERWSVTLPAVVRDEPATKPGAREPLWPTGWALAGVGVPALAVGLTFALLHHRPYRNRCGGDDYDERRDLCRYRWNSLVPGATLTAVGGALAIAGVTMIALGHKRRHARRDARAKVTIELAADLARTRAGLVLLGHF